MAVIRCLANAPDALAKASRLRAVIIVHVARDVRVASFVLFVGEVIFNVLVDIEYFVNKCHPKVIDFGNRMLEYLYEGQ